MDVWSDSLNYKPLGHVHLQLQVSVGNLSRPTPHKHIVFRVSYAPMNQIQDGHKKITSEIAIDLSGLKSNTIYAIEVFSTTTISKDIPKYTSKPNKLNTIYASTSKL